MAKGRKTGGRQKGTVNKVTRSARQAIGLLLNGQSHKVAKWLDEIYETGGAKAAFNCYIKLLEYHVPKLSRTEIQGNPTLSLEDMLKAAAAKRAAAQQPK
jgi:hypothetical protein